MNPQASTLQTLDHLFRHNAGQMVAVLVCIFGIEKIDLIEDAIQDSMLAAMKKWPFGGIPSNPNAWLIQTAKNKVLDQLRRGKFVAELETLEKATEFRSEIPDEVHYSGEIAEDQLRMMFACCDPAIPADSQVALTLKTVGGFSIREIARAFLANDGSIAKLLTRAKQKLKSGNVRFEIPLGDLLGERTDSVLRVLYLMFNEGYSATSGDELIRRELCHEAIRLCTIVADHPTVGEPRADALLALFFFQAARLETRVGSGGDLIMLSHQDRMKWDAGAIAAGLERLHRSARGDQLSDYHIEAEIASIHSLAPTFAETDWARIIECYELLLARSYSPVIDLNRIVAIGQAKGELTALAELERLGQHYLMTSFGLFHIVTGHFLSASGQNEEAKTAFRRAVKLTENEPVRRYIAERLSFL